MATTFNDLPRDIIKLIITKLDIDTRVKMGFIFTLKVPTHINSEISRCLQVPHTYPTVEDWWFIKLGPYIFPNDNEYQRYHLTHYYGFGSMVYLTTHAILGKGTINYSTQDLESEYDQLSDSDDDEML